MHDEREDSNSEEDNESVQTIRKLGRDRLMRVHTKSSKARISNKDIEFKGLLKIVTLNMLRNLEFDYWTLVFYYDIDKYIKLYK